MHFYKRDLTPLKENYAICQEKLPYKQNFQNYEGNLMSKAFKNQMLNNLGGQVRCVSSSVSSKRFSTFQIITEKPAKKKKTDTSMAVDYSIKDHKDVSPVDQRKTASNWGKILKNRRQLLDTQRSQNIMSCSPDKP